MIRASFKDHSQRNALFVNGQYYTYQDLEGQVAAICNFIANNHSEQTAIGVVGNQDLKSYASIIAIMLLGKTFIPILNDMPLERNQYILQLSEVQLVLNSQQKTVTEFDRFIPDMKEGYYSIPKLKLKDDDVLTVLFTSGSTGVPKGVPYSLGNINCSLDAYFKLDTRLSSNDRFLQMFDFNFDMSMLSYLPAFCIGACVYPCQSKGIKYLSAIEILVKHHITVATLVPTTLNLLRPYFSTILLPALRRCFVGGEPFDCMLAAEWQKCLPEGKVFNISGPTETTMACMGYVLPKDSERYKHHNGILAFGLPWSNTEAIIVDEHNNIVPILSTGNLSFSGDNLMKGYLKMDEHNEEVFFYKEGKRFYKTGDMAFVDENGLFYTCGRIDNQVKIDGYKVELGEVEYICKNTMNLNSAVAIALRLNVNVTRIVLFYESQLELDHDYFLSLLKSQLPDFMLPVKLIWLVQFPINSNGKIDRLRLKEMIQDEL